MGLTQYVKAAQVVTVPCFRYEKPMMVENVIDSESSDVSIGLITAPSLEIAKKLASKL